MLRTVSTSSFALMLGAGAAFADVTPAEVWDSIRSGYEDMGYSVTVGSEDASDERLSLSDITVATDTEDGASFEVGIPGLVMEQDGAVVRSVFEGQMALTIRDTVTPYAPETAGEDAPKPEPREVGFDATIDAPGNVMISSGSAGDMTHSMSMPTATLKGSPLDEVNSGTVEMTLTDLTSTQRSVTAENGDVSQEFQGAIAELAGSFAASGPSAEGQDGTDSFDATFAMADLTFDGNATQPGGTTFETDPEASLAAGFVVDGTIGTGPFDFSFDGTATDETGAEVATSGAMKATGGELTVEMSKDGFGYGGFAEGTEYSLESGDMPFPINYGIARSEFSLRMPVSRSDEAQPFALKLGLVDLALDDAIWQGLDPQNTLPREPANVNIDLSGTAMVTENLMAQDAAPQMGAKPPFTPSSLQINEIALDAVGASANVTGSLEFGDNPNEPVGQLKGSFTGINSLLDNLVAMGLVPQEQVMGARMMMAMFTRPAEGQPDTLETQLKFTEGGSIFANGQQVK
ncbi:DUF2125 domain-containing protein [Paracoccus zeaxanthinifaciens]|uniref:DUF2125 domain-containing protein n=1 Tax=Paracoccus zeaxanthinifaciens TaxID=187400 RepID=UPI0003B4D4EB|nr:DUF2125 domain-containing protein [Paracoccus zeaxanthinifaciens]